MTNTESAPEAPATMTITEAFAWGDALIEARGWKRNESQDWVRPEDGRPARLSATPDHKNKAYRTCVRLEIAFAAMGSEDYLPPREEVWATS